MFSLSMAFFVLFCFVLFFLTVVLIRIINNVKMLDAGQGTLKVCFPYQWWFSHTIMLPRIVNNVELLDSLLVVALPSEIGDTKDFIQYIYHHVNI